MKTTTKTKLINDANHSPLRTSLENGGKGEIIVFIMNINNGKTEEPYRISKVAHKKLIELHKKKHTTSFLLKWLNKNAELVA